LSTFRLLYPELEDLFLDSLLRLKLVHLVEMR
jgi:hypothetical protein